MAKDTSPPLKEIIQNPGAHFDGPLAVVDAKTLSPAAKKKVLDAWEDDARRLAVATEEGMTGGEASHLAEVAEAKAELHIVDTRRPGPTKAG
jgi:hypothetical protein